MENVTNVGMTNTLIVIARSMEKVGDVFFSKFGLTMRTYEILIQINRGITTTLELSKIMQTTPASIAQKTRVLEEKKLIKRTVGKEDKRIWHFSHTKKGQEVLRNIQLIYEQANSHLYSQYSAKEKQQILDFLAAIEEHLTFVLQNKNKINEFVNKNIIPKNRKVYISK